MSNAPRTVIATPPGESGWSFQTFLGVFAASLPMWMRRFGVRAADIDDATQEALVEAWQSLSTLPTAHDKARYQMLLLAVKIAQRWRRHAARLQCVDELEVHDPHDAEAWIAARMLLFEALYRLDEPTRKLLIAHKIDKRTYQQIGVELGEKEDTIRKRVKVAEKKLQDELVQLLGTNKGRNGSSAAMGVLLALDSFDRAVFRAILDVEEDLGLGPSPASTVRPKAVTKPWPWQSFPMGILAGALFLVPGQGWRTEAIYAEKLRNLPLPAVEVRAAMHMPSAESANKQEPLPGKTVSSARGVVPVPELSRKDASVVKRLIQDGSFHTRRRHATIDPLACRNERPGKTASTFRCSGSWHTWHPVASGRSFLRAN